jgi:hypothetical protein
LPIVHVFVHVFVLVQELYEERRLRPTGFSRGIGVEVAVKLKLGRFYMTAVGARWCCFRIDEKAAEHCQAYCVEVATQRVDLFYLDGRYSHAPGHRDNTLVGEVLDEK